MHVSALNLFLMECAAQSLKNDDELGGGLASSLQKRHKIRNTDLDQLFKVANPMGSLLFSRIYVIFNLLHYAGAAYRNVADLVESAPNAMGNVQVKPHWDPTNNYSFDKIYDWEPMNLFPGWSLTNTRNNNHVFDPHVVFWENGVMSNDLHGVLHNQNGNPTEGMQMASHLHQNDYAVTQHRLGGNGLPNRTRRYSAYSSHFHRNEDKELGTLAKLQSGKTQSVNHQRAIEKFTSLLARFRESTQAGNLHYTRLLGSLTQQGFNAGHPVVAELTTAQTNWNAHRNLNIQTLEGYLNEIKGWANPGAFTMHFPTNK
ncbi:hypothetical protein V0R50_18300 [Pseudomonas sp. 148P]|uniref:Uncharacterized protein n=1 Tax=Pseudomonas ulcerans TaxID=3115852 RepID=A0ABU7HUG3_9PSED|nr:MULTISPECIES: hypothetical protein [unclassified Pseudomonas]MEE1924052.1 hypothetical protein [Pseudomonas sp. 147P]MEE1935185.1 hypothetical protein [Pseudomonas sp. 148P]